MMMVGYGTFWFVSMFKVDCPTLRSIQVHGEVNTKIRDVGSIQKKFGQRTNEHAVVGVIRPAYF